MVKGIAQQLTIDKNRKSYIEDMIQGFQSLKDTYKDINIGKYYKDKKNVNRVAQRIR